MTYPRKNSRCLTCNHTLSLHTEGCQGAGCECKHFLSRRELGEWEWRRLERDAREFIELSNRNRSE